MKLNLKNDLLRHSLLLFISMMVVNLSNMGYQMVVSRLLPPSEYAFLASFLGVLLILSRPMSVLSTGMNHYTRILLQEHREGDIKRLLRKWILLSLLPAILLCLLTILFRKPLCELFNLNRELPLLVLALSLPVFFVMPVLTGTIQGLQYFVWASAASILRGILRIVLSALALLCFYRTSGWALAGHSASIGAAGILLFLVLWSHLRKTVPSASSLPSMKLYLAQSSIVLAGYSILMTSDVVLINHYFPEQTDFSYAATLGRLVASVSLAVGMAMFPKVVSSGEETQQHKSLFTRSILYSLFCTIPALLVCFLIPKFLLSFIFGIHSPSPTMLSYVRWIAIVMGFSSILYIVVQYAVAQRRFFAVMPVILFALLYLLSAHFFHQNTLQIIIAALCCNLAALISSLLLLTKKSPEKEIV